MPRGQTVWDLMRLPVSKCEGAGDTHGLGIHSPSMTLLIAWLALTVLYVLGGMWVYLRKAGTRQLTKRISVVLLLLFLMTLVPIQCLTEYSISLYFGPVLILALSFGACLLEEILVWREGRMFGLAGIPGLVAALTVFVGLFLSSGWMFDLTGTASLPLMSGRLSPVLSYRLTAGQSVWGASTIYRYEIYKNPLRFPFVQRRIQSESVPLGCMDPDGIASHRIVPEISLGPDAKTLHLTCAYPDSEIRPDTTVDVRLQN